ILCGAAFRCLPAHEPQSTPLSNQQDEEDEADRRKQSEKKAAGLRVGDADNEGEQAPCDDVVDGGACQSKYSEARFLHSAIRENASQDRECGYGHRYTDEESERGEGDG